MAWTARYSQIEKVAGVEIQSPQGLDSTKAVIRFKHCERSLSTRVRTFAISDYDLTG